MTHVPIPPVRLHNINDAAAFTVEALERSGITYDEHEREDLISEGIAILCTMASKWAPEEHGDGTGSFLGYAHTYLPRRLLDAWHKSHPEHSYRTQPDGRRRWEYGREAHSLEHRFVELSNYDGPVWESRAGAREGGLSIDPRHRLNDAVLERDPLEHVTMSVPAATFVGTPVHLIAADVIDVPEHDRLAGTVRRALAATLEDETDLHLRVSVMLASGVSRQEVQQRLGLTGDDLKAILGRLRRCAHMMDPTVRAA
jgi:hypothetical protein